MSINTTIQIAARTDVGMERDHNEDNFIVCSNVSKQEWSFDNQKVFNLDEYGSLLVVADGMGGMNAGEVASQVAVESMKEYFLQNVHQIELQPDIIKNIMKKSILYANDKIVERQRTDISTEGMGTTLIIAWIINNKLYCSWSGDSRCYLFNNNLSNDIERKTWFEQNKRIVTNNLTEISKDHSYVQELIDKGKITPEQAFYHPDGNIVTQSLGSSSHIPKPDFFYVNLKIGDRILLCSDGLNGMLQDKQINEIIQQRPDINNCAKELIDNSNKAGGLDNITIIIADIINVSAEDTPLNNNFSINENLKKYAKYILGPLLIALTIIILFKFFKKTKPDKIIVQQDFTVILNGDTININKGDTLCLKKVASNYQKLEYTDSLICYAIIPNTNDTLKIEKGFSFYYPIPTDNENNTIVDDNKTRPNNNKNDNKSNNNQNNDTQTNDDNQNNVKNDADLTEIPVKDTTNNAIPIKNNPKNEGLTPKDTTNNKNNSKNELTPVKDKNGKWGYKNSNNEFIIKAEYEFCTPFSCGLGAVKKDKKWGFIDSNGEIIIEPKYKNAQAFSKYGQKFRALVLDESGKCLYINKDGDKIDEADCPDKWQ